jgi:glucose/arabinose dehydrogenase
VSLLWPRLCACRYGRGRRPLIGPRTFWLFAGALVCLATSAPAGPYRQSPDKSCDGYPSIDIPTSPGVCVSVIASGLGFPRGVVSLSDSQVLVADMGGWERGRGRLLLLDISPDGEPARVRVLLSRLDRPHGLIRTSAGKLYLGEATRISEIRISGNTAQVIPVMTGAPGAGRHPLIGLAAMDGGKLAFSTGSATDDCDGAMRAGVCTETIGQNARAAIRVFTPGSTPIRWADIAPYATGLRNSAALAFDPVSGVLWAGENGMDLTSATLPPDELNRIEEGKNYGWPACYGMAVRAAGFSASSCRGTATPARNLAAHSAPLGIMVLEGGLAKTGRAVAITSHGYMPSGHRITLVPINARGDLAGPNRDIVFGWNAARGIRPTGTPVGITTAPRGGLYVTEDGNGTLLRVSMQFE